MVEGKMSVIKYLMFFFNFLFWLSGLVLIVIGAIIRDKYGDYFAYADSKFANAAVFIIIVGVVVFIIGFLGCCGAVKENYCMVTTFAVLLAIIFILEIVAGALGFTYKKKVDAVAQKALKQAVGDYGTNDGEKKLLDWAQKTFECCGVEGPADFAKSKNVTLCKGVNKGVPSCHKGGTCAGELRKSGCRKGFIDFIKEKLVIIGAVAVGIAFIQLLGIIFACFLMKAIKGEYEVV